MTNILYKSLIWSQQCLSQRHCNTNYDACGFYQIRPTSKNYLKSNIQKAKQTKICPSMKRAIKSTAASCWLFYGNLEHNVKKKSLIGSKKVLLPTYTIIYMRVSPTGLLWHHVRFLYGREFGTIVEIYRHLLTSIDIRHLKTSVEILRHLYRPLNP